MGQTNPTSHTDRVLVGATVYTSPEATAIREGVILIRNGEIAAVGGMDDIDIPAGAERIDCSGRTITAGFWNSHVHFFERKWAEAQSVPASELERQLQDMLGRYGFTSVFDTGSVWENTRAIRDRIESGDVSGPRIRSTGEALIAPDAMPADTILRVLGFMPFPTPEINDAAQAAAASKQLLAQGVDGIKLHLQPPPAPHPPFPADAMAPAVRAAHLAGKPVFVHPSSGADVLASVRAGVDIIAHTTPSSGPWDEDLLATMKQQGVSLTPTLTLWKSFLRHDRLSVQDQISDTAIGQLRAWVEVGGEVLFGTDLGAVDYDPREEYRLMVRAGMDFRQILASLTTAPAARFGESERLGRIEKGFLADLVVLKGDPSKDIETLASVEFALRDGEILYRASRSP